MIRNGSCICALSISFSVCEAFRVLQPYPTSMHVYLDSLQASESNACPQHLIHQPLKNLHFFESKRSVKCQYTCHSIGYLRHALKTE